MIVLQQCNKTLYSTMSRKEIIMVFGFDHINNVDYYNDGEEMKNIKKELWGYTEEQADTIMDIVALTGGAAYVFVTHELKESLPHLVVPHWQKREPVSIGKGIFFVNLYKLTPEEEMAIISHEMGHAACGHMVSTLANEMEADRIAAMTVGPDIIKSALVKIDKALRQYGSRYIAKENMAIRIEALTF